MVTLRVGHLNRLEGIYGGRIFPERSENAVIGVNSLIQIGNAGCTCTVSPTPIDRHKSRGRCMDVMAVVLGHFGLRDRLAAASAFTMRGMRHCGSVQRILIPAQRLGIVRRGSLVIHRAKLKIPFSPNRRA